MTDTPADRRKNAHLTHLLQKAKDHVVTPSDINAQRKSWVCGEMLLRYPTMTYEDASARYDTVISNAPPLSTHEPVGWWYQDSTGCIHMSMDVELGYRHQRESGHPLNMLYGKPLPDEPFTPPPSTHVAGYEEAIDAAKMARTRLMTYANGVQRGEIQGGGREFERRIWGAFSDFDQACDAIGNPSPQTNTTGLTELETELLAALKRFRDTIIGEVHDKWDEGMRAGKLIVALANPTLPYRRDISEIHEAIAKAEARAATTEGQP